jgi:hypothetical protein
MQKQAKNTTIIKSALTTKLPLELAYRPGGLLQLPLRKANRTQLRKLLKDIS